MNISKYLHMHLLQVQVEMQIQVVLVLWCTGAAGTGAPLLVQVSVVLSGRQVVDGALGRVVLPCQCNVQLLKSNGCE